MEKENFQFNSKKRPADFPHEYDGHIYFSSLQFPQIEALRVSLISNFSSDSVFVGDVIPRPAGPHTMPMLEINFTAVAFFEVVKFLMENRGELSILVHSISKDDFYDHTQGALWLGTQVPLDFSKL